MKVSLISSSHRQDSQSRRVREILNCNLKLKKEKIEKFNLDLSITKLPMWSVDKSKKLGFWGQEWSKISSEIKSSDAILFIVPEYGGMAAPNAKNFF